MERINRKDFEVLYKKTNELIEIVEGIEEEHEDGE